MRNRGPHYVAKLVKTWSQCMLCVGICYRLSQINMPRYAHQEIALTERRIRCKAQKAFHALAFIFSAFCSLPAHYLLICQLTHSACHWRRFWHFQQSSEQNGQGSGEGHSISREMRKFDTSHFIFCPEDIIVKAQLVLMRSKYSLMQET